MALPAPAVGLFAVFFPPFVQEIHLSSLPLLFCRGSS
ncbi:hypothetical protein NC653_011862 [Populus alba x Populus x berolinensis]|uniref:Uncharacterized protein n=1 Tax=Populus alba x Populus x berolinensis TaxID=444605 RepID=A0AAD6W7G3_9ROSI|nr:hypothetical protein NC653_011862 [Populus alba x Populus x berolinensis]